MADDDQDSEGFEDASDPAAQLKLMDDATLMKAYRSLSNPRVVLQTSTWIDLLEQEIQDRGLMSLN